MIKITIDTIMYLCQIFFFSYYCETLFYPKKNRVLRFTFIIIANIVMCLVYQLNITYLNVILMFMINTFLFWFLYDVSVKISLFHSLIFMAVLLASEILTMAISNVLFKDFNALENSTVAYAFVVSISKIIYYGIMMIILRAFAQKEENSSNSKLFWLLFILPLTSLLVLLAFRYIAYITQMSKPINILCIISSVGLIIANITVFAIYEYSLKNTKELYELKAMARQEEQDKKYFDVIEQSNNDMRVLAHDMKNHFVQIRNLDDAGEIHKYIDSLDKEIDKFTYAGISKNKTLDLILSKYMKLCEAKNIHLTIDVKTANLNYIENTDLATLLNNLLDNALEAAVGASNSEIQIKIFSKNNIYDALFIKNSCKTPPEIKDGKLQTTKENHTSHGWGIQSVQKIVKKYQGVFNWKYDENDNSFEINIVFMKSH